MTDRELKALYDKAQEYYRRAELCMAEWRQEVQKQLHETLLKEMKREERRSR